VCSIFAIKPVALRALKLAKCLKNSTRIRPFAVSSVRLKVDPSLVGLEEAPFGLGEAATLLMRDPDSVYFPDQRYCS
jgi:hypothetical protein